MRTYREAIESLIAVCGESGIDDQRILDACAVLELNDPYGLPTRERDYVEKRAISLDTSQSHVIKQAVRIYQLWQEFPQLGEEFIRLKEAAVGKSPGCGSDE